MPWIRPRATFRSIMRTHDAERTAALRRIMNELLSGRLPVPVALPDTRIPTVTIDNDWIGQTARTVDLPLRFEERIHSGMIRAFAR